MDGFMEKFDVLVVGSGSGMIVVANAVAASLQTALVEFGPIGGTCLNRGCIPSKMLIYPADVIQTVREGKNVDVEASVGSVDFSRIMKRMHDLVEHDSKQEEEGVKNNPYVTWYKEQGEFVSDYTMRIGDQTVKADRIFIVSGARPEIPPIIGLDKTDYLTSDTVLQVDKPPESIIIIGGGYVAMEYSHFFSSIGTEVTIIQRAPRILPEEEPEISELLRQEVQNRVAIFTDYDAVEVKEEAEKKKVFAKNNADGSMREFSAESLLVAAGRIPNSDLLKPERTGVELDHRGFVKVNEFLETGKKGIWAFGDAIGKQMFKHVANYEAEVAWHNAIHDHKIKMDYSAAPHAVFSHPQVASVGLKENEARLKGYKILIGKSQYKDTALGAAMGNPEGFVKVIVEHDTGKILGGHIIGPYASVLIQEIVNAMAAEDKTYTPIIRGLHIHPAMNEVVQKAFGALAET
jgi:dihydrolipoamide dehydrogenase